MGLLEGEVVGFAQLHAAPRSPMNNLLKHHLYQLQVFVAGAAEDVDADEEGSGECEDEGDGHGCVNPLVDEAGGGGLYRGIRGD